MIKVAKPTIIPNVLTTTGLAETVKNCGLYTTNTASYNNGKLKFKISGSIYNADKVKAALKKAQYKKCCFCEKTQADEYGAVEHYRPKAAYKLKRKTALKRPGYYWLGYQWDNLFFVCGPCNTKKGSLFPLKDESKRALNHNGNVSREAPLLLNPTGRKDPTKHIKFTNQFISGVTPEGKQTIEICKLDRDGLNEERKKLLNEIDERITIVITNQDPGATLRAKKYLKKAVSEDAPFSAMVKDYLKSLNFVIT
jgi:hypothetical protein